MHIAFLNCGGKLNFCPLCAEEQADPQSPKYVDADRRKKPPIPCPEHGDPRILWEENRQAIEIYKRLAPHHFFKEYQVGEQTKKRIHYDVNLAIALCRIYEVENIPEMLEKIDVIHEEYHHE